MTSVKIVVFIFFKTLNRFIPLTHTRILQCIQTSDAQGLPTRDAYACYTNVHEYSYSLKKICLMNHNQPLLF